MKYNFAQNSLISSDLNSLSQSAVSVRICFSSCQETMKYAFQEIQTTLWKVVLPYDSGCKLSCKFLDDMALDFSLFSFAKD